MAEADKPAMGYIIVDERKIRQVFGVSSSMVHS
jgi:hypothetical protein